MPTQVAHPSSLFTARQRWAYLAVLFLVSVTAYLDRTILTVLLEPIKREFGVSDTALGLLSGITFALFYATLGIPLARWADRGDRKTIIALAVGMWSLMTALCGLVGQFWHLVLARVGVGVGEAGSMAPAQSLVADYFPPAMRARALSILVMSSAIGNLLGIVVGGQVAASHGWRAAFLVAAAPGLVLALLVPFTLAEPRKQLAWANASFRPEAAREALRALRDKRSYLLLVGALTLYFLLAHGVLTFTPSYMLRLLGADLATVAVQFGLVSAGATLAGTVLGGWLTDRLQARDSRWTFWLPALGLLLAWVLMTMQFLVTSLNAFLVFAALGTVVLLASVPGMFTALHAVCGSRRRTTAVALAFFCGNLFGMGLGPVAVGLISDALQASHGAAGLRVALLAVLLLFPPTAWMVWRASFHLNADRED